MSSLGKIVVTEWATVSPPIPLSKIPIGWLDFKEVDFRQSYSKITRTKTGHLRYNSFKCHFMSDKVNLTQIVKILRNDKKLVSEALDILISNAEVEKSNLVKYHHEKNWELVSLSAHNLKSKMKYIGCGDAAALLSEMESAGRDPNKIWRIDNLLNNFEKEYSFIANELLEVKQDYSTH